MTHKHPDIDDLFALARADALAVPERLSQRILADALQEMPRLSDTQVIVRPNKRGFFGLGWASFAGLAGSAVVGVTLGMSNPDFSDNLTADSYSISDLMPDFGVELTEEVAG
jgi:hypothetical protein